MKTRKRQWYEGLPGVHTQLEFAFRFIAWASARRQPATITDAVAHFGMSRSTACRYLNAYRNSGQPKNSGRTA